MDTQATPRQLAKKQLDGSKGKEAKLSSGLVDQLVHTCADGGLSWVTLSSKVVVLDVIVDEARRLGEKVMVFTQRLRTLEFLKSHIGSRGHTVYHQEGKTRDWQQLVSNFNNDPRLALFIVFTTAGGTGLNF